MASGDNIRAALGFDRSGWAEAIVYGKGMPKLPEGQELMKGEVGYK